MLIRKIEVFLRRHRHARHQVRPPGRARSALRDSTCATAACRAPAPKDGWNIS